MNATTFFTEDQFRSLKCDILAQKVIDINSTPYGKRIKINGNTYQIRITTGYLKVGDCSYYTSLWDDYSYKGKREDREIGGGCGGRVVLDSYEAFCADINGLLRKFPDFTEPKPTFEQMSLF